MSKSRAKRATTKKKSTKRKRTSAKPSASDQLLDAVAPPDIKAKELSYTQIGAIAISVAHLSEAGNPLAGWLHEILAGKSLANKRRILAATFSHLWTLIVTINLMSQIEGDTDLIGLAEALKSMQRRTGHKAEKRIGGKGKGVKGRRKTKNGA